MKVLKKEGFHEPKSSRIYNCQTWIFQTGEESVAKHNLTVIIEDVDDSSKIRIYHKLGLRLAVTVNPKSCIFSFNYG